MAEDYKGLTLKFSADYSDLTSALSGIGKQASSAQAQLRRVQSALKMDPGNTALLAKQQEALASKVSATKSKIDAYKDALSVLDDKQAQGETLTEKQKKQYEQLQTSIATTGAQLKSYTKQLESARVEYAAQESALGKLGTKLEDVGDRYGSMGETVSKASGVALTAVAGVAAASLAAFESVDTATDEAIRKTGATGAAADALSASVKNVGASAAAAKADWSDIGDTVGAVNVKFGVTGDALEKLSEQFLEFGENTGTTAADDVETVAQAMGIFNVDASQTQSVLGLLQATSQATGASVTDLMGQVQENGATFQSMGLSLDQSVTLLGSFEQSGYDSTQMLAALKKAAATYNDEGKDMKTGLADLVTRLQDSSTQAEATSEAYDLFGTRAGTTFVKAAQSGKVNLTDLSGSLSDYASTVSDTFGATEDGVDHAQQALKSLQETGATLGEALSDVMGPTLESASENVKDFADGLDSMSDGEKQSAAQAVVATTAFLGVVTVGGKLVGSLKGMGEGLSSAATFFAKVGGAANVAEEGISASAVAMGVAKTGGIALATIALAAIVTEYQRVQKNAENYSKATDGLNDAVKRASSLSDAASKSTSTLTDKYSAQKVTIDEAIESQAKLSDAIKSNNDEATSNMGTLSSAQSVIDAYANKTDLSTQAQGELKAAIEQVNTQCGTQYTVTDAANGKISDEQGVVQDTTAAIDAYIAKKKEQIRLDSLTDDLTQAYKDQATQIQAVNTAEDDLANTEKALKSYQDSASVDKDPLQLKSLQQDVDNATKKVDDANSALQRSQSTIDMLNGSIGATQSAVDGTASAIAQFASGKSEITTTLEQYGQDLSGFSTDLESTGVSVESLQTLSSDQLMTLARNYDGTETSIAAALASMGIDIDAAAASSKASIADMASSIQSLSDNGTIDLSALGLSAHDLSQKLSDAGVTTQAQAAIANGAFAGMLTQSGGDINSLISIIAGYNSTPIVDKDGNITVNDASLTDAQGNLYTWNGSTLLDKDGNAVVDDVSLTDAQGNAVTWNGTSLSSKSASAGVDGNAVDGTAQTSVGDTSGAVESLSDKTITAQVNGNATERSVADNLWSVVGAIGKLAGHTISMAVTGNASGGIIPSHADGGAINGIVTRRTLTNRGWVGEDGAEAVFSSHADGAIVPLTNSHYVAPFARAVAQQMLAVSAEQAQGARASTPTSVTASLDAKALGKIVADEVRSSLSGMGVYVGKKFVGAIAPDMDVELARIGARR